MHRLGGVDFLSLSFGLRSLNSMSAPGGGPAPSIFLYLSPMRLARFFTCEFASRSKMGAGASLLFGPAAASNLTASSLSPAANKLSKRLAKQIARDRLKEHEYEFDHAADADEEREDANDEEVKSVFDHFVVVQEKHGPFSGQ